jgi:hypothetical protein
MFYINLDCCDMDMLVDDCNVYGISLEVIEETGPAGGWPYISLGHHDKAFLREFVYKGWGDYFEDTDYFEI